MKRTLSVILSLVLLITMFTATGCGSKEAVAQSTDGAQQVEKKSGEKEVYVWACQYNSLPLFVNNDYIGLDIAAEELGVEVRKIGPQNIDLPAFIAATEQEIAKKPAGMMIVGWDVAQADSINKVYDAGIPVVTVDSDIPQARRTAFIGTDWYDLGVEMAKALEPKLKDKQGKAVALGVAGGDADQSCLRGFTDTMRTLCPGISVEQKIYNSNSNAGEVAKTMSNLIKGDSSIIAAIGTDSASGPGISLAINEANKAGQIFATCVDAEQEQLQGVKDGSLVACIGQKRLFFTYYGLKMLYDMNHSRVQFTKDDKKFGITNIPTKITTGFIVVNKDNVDGMIEAANSKVK